MDTQERTSIFGGKNDPQGQAYEQGYKAAQAPWRLEANPYDGQDDLLAEAYDEGFLAGLKAI